MLFYLIMVLSCSIFSYLFACLVSDEWIDPFEGYKERKERKKWVAIIKQREAEYFRLKAKKAQEWKEEKQRRAAQAVETRERQAQKAAIKAAKRAAHEQRTLANKLRKEEARMEYSLRMWGIPYIEPK